MFDVVVPFNDGLVFCFGGVHSVKQQAVFRRHVLRKYLRLAPISRFMSESRAARRHRVLKAGAIEFSGGGAISCAVKNLSASGAALEVVSALDIPDRLILCISAEHFKRHCHVVWRNEKRIGVAFE
jgi:hypothetical protein